jgi:Family of unknown function (DUF6404)
MTHRQKIDRLIPELKAKGVGQYTMTAPPLFRMLWAFGIEIPPPLFMRFIPLAVFYGVTWSCLTAALFWFVGPPEVRPHILPVIAPFGIVMGLVAGLYFRWKAGALGLPSWENYGNSN